MAHTANTNSTREAALARRRAMSTTGKAALGSSASRTAGTAGTSAQKPAPAAAPANPSAGKNMPAARVASLARRAAMSSMGKAAVTSKDRVRHAPQGAESTTNPLPAAPAEPREAADGGCGCGCKDGERASTEPRSSRPVPKPRATTIRPRKAAATSTSRAAALARRQGMSSRGKAGLSPNGMTAAQTARAANPHLSGRELAQALRAQRSRNGNAGQKKSEPSGHMRPGKATASGAAQDAPWKVGVSETSQGQTLTGTMVGRSSRVTGDEPSTCREVTGTEYLGADIFRAFCQTEPAKRPRKVGVSPTSRGSGVTGTEVGRSNKVTGDEPGTCKRVTGTEYVGAKQGQSFCDTKPEAGPAKVTRTETRKGKPVSGSNVGRSSRVTGDEAGAARELTGTQYMQAGNGQFPAKVGTSQTLRGGSVTGTLVGRSGRVTGDEPGSCSNITGDDYVGQEHYSGFCEKIPAPQDTKVGASKTLKGEGVTGTMTGRSERVTGDEPGTCKAITGTPYAGAEQYQSYCKPEESSLAAARTRLQRSTPGSVMTGKQPGLNGKLTGAEKGACEPLTGTPYVGADQFATACPASPAEPGSPDFPQPMGTSPWGQFSVTPPAHANQAGVQPGAVTGTRYEQGQITGPFGKAAGRVTGTEEARFGRGNGAEAPSVSQTAETVEGRVKSRITGEGMDAGLRITGDDWERGDRVTGTEGTSAMQRNPTRRGGPVSAMPAQQPGKRNEDVSAPVSKVTGSAGSTEKGSLVTYSGGARG